MGFSAQFGSRGWTANTCFDRVSKRANRRNEPRFRSGVGSGGSVLAKHVCGSCRFFDEARDGKHGWCTHPDRRETSSVRILVRAGELRCRNDWGQDQWEERVASDQVLGVVMNDTDQHLPSRKSRELPAPIQLPSFDSPVPANFTSTPLTPVAESAPDSPNAEDERTVSADLNRELLRRAHAQARERLLKKGYSVPSPRNSEPEPLVISNQYIPPSRDAGTPVNRGMTDSVFEFGSEKSGVDFDAVPEFDGSGDLPGASTRRDRALSRRPARHLESELEPQAWPDEPFDEAALPELERAVDGFAQGRWADDEQFNSSRQETSALNLPAADTHEARPEDDAEEFITWEQARAPEQPAEPHRIWADIPRCCQTCRDFRPAGGGERGWCNNQWAFKHRRMVDAHDRPCETSIGHWWIPGDAAWQGEFDISALGQPTPLMDKWFGHSRGGNEPAVAQGDRRKRKTGSW